MIDIFQETSQACCAWCLSPCRGQTVGTCHRRDLNVQPPTLPSRPVLLWKMGNVMSFQLRAGSQIITNFSNQTELATLFSANFDLYDRRFMCWNVARTQLKRRGSREQHTIFCFFIGFGPAKLKKKGHFFGYPF